MDKEKDVAIKEFDLAWEEYFKDKPEPKNEDQDRKQVEEFYHWYNYVRKQSDTKKTPVEMYKETYAEEPPNEVIKESRIFNFKSDDENEFLELEEELSRIADDMFEKDVWKQTKIESKDSSKKELAKMMFITGFLMHNKFIIEETKHIQEEIKKDPDGFRKMIEEFRKDNKNN